MATKARATRSPGDHLLTLIPLSQLRASIIRPKIVPRLASTLQIILGGAAVCRFPGTVILLSDMAAGYVNI